MMNKCRSQVSLYAEINERYGNIPVSRSVFQMLRDFNKYYFDKRSEFGLILHHVYQIGKFEKIIMISLIIKHKIKQEQ